MCATATSWALLLPAFGAFQRLLSRGFLARGFLEEVFVGQVNSPMIEMGGESQYGTPFGMAHFECAAAGSGALAIKDGLDTAYVGWNPESDMGNIEIWEQNMPMIYLGRSILADSGGAGKYRGGCAFVSTWLLHRTAHLRLVTSEHSSRVLDNAGMCGGYPAPTCQKHRVVRGANIGELASKRKPLAHAPGTAAAVSNLQRLVGGEHITVEGPYITAPHRAGDIFSHSYNGGGGYGDVLERDPVKTAADVENGYLTREAARNVFGIILEAGAEGSLTPDLRATAIRRRRMRERRLKKSIPVSQWMKAERRRVTQARFVPEVLRMYGSAMKLSPRFAAEFCSFWQLAKGFTFPSEH
jgi:acetone carboxylase alpha subunit